MAKMHKYLKIRGKKYYLRVPIPKEIQEIMGKKEILRSLKTSDLVQANLRYPDALAKIQKEFVIAKSKTKQMASVPLVGFNPFETVHDWFHTEHAKTTLIHRSQFSNNVQIEEYILGLKSDLVELMLRNSERSYHMVQLFADELLIDLGYPKKEGTNFANIDSTDPKYTQFLDLLITAKIELTEYELERLGQRITRTPNGRVFWKEIKPMPPSLKSAKTISELIDEYMEVKGGTGKKKTVSDKYAAYRYLTETVGEGFLVENLSREHFLEVRKILSAFPKNAKKQKVLKGKSLKEISTYAKVHGLELMSKQNANKIIARLKSLMAYAVSTAVIPNNPCEEIKFQISQAEKDAAAREPFSDDQLRKLFSSEAFNKDYPKGAAMYWAPLIALLHGFRMEEILILTLNEVKLDEKTKVKYFDLTDFTTDEVKNSNARRRVPIHPMMKSLGFHAYLSGCKNHKGRKLFPELKRSKSKLDQTYRKKFSPEFSKYIVAIGVHTKKTVFHSFRRNFSIACTNGEIPVDYENALAGWTLAGGQKGTYKKPKDLSLDKLAKMMSKIDYPNLDLSHLYVE